MDALGNSGDFYRRPLSGPGLQYSKQPVGVNKLGNFMKDICAKGGVSGNLTNHSGKRTCATTLYRNRIDEQDIMDRTGHRSTDAVRKYKRCSDDIRRAVSSVLDPTPPKKLKSENEPVPGTSGSCDITHSKECDSPKKLSSNVTFARNPLTHITGNSANINFSGCTFNF